MTPSPTPPNPPDPPIWLQLLRSRWLWTGIAAFIFAAFGLNQFLDRPPNPTPSSTPTSEATEDDVVYRFVVRTIDPAKKSIVPVRNVNAKIFADQVIPDISDQYGYIRAKISRNIKSVRITLEKEGYIVFDRIVELKPNYENAIPLDLDPETSSPKSDSTSSSTPIPSSTAQTNNSQISVLFDNKWVKIPRADSLNYWEDNHPVSRRKRIAFLVTEEKLNSLGVLTAKIDATVNQLGGNWRNNAPDTWDGTAVTCFVNIQRRGGGLNYIPCQL